MDRVRVLCYGMGVVGGLIAKSILEKEGVEIVGAVDIAKDKVGKDLGDVLELHRKTGVVVSDSLDHLPRSAKADVAVHATSSYLKDTSSQIAALVARGVNTDEAYATDYIERNYGDASQRSYPYDGDDALVYAASGFIWDNALNHGLTFRDYGEFVQPIIEPQSTWAEIWEDYRSGAGKIKIRAATYLENLKPYICPDFIGFPSLVSDQYRADVFLREFEEFERNGELPNLVMMLLPNDHTVGTRPSMPTPQAMVADNDLALGRIVEAITESRFWPKTCIFVVEDDPQAGLDHVDGHRTVAFVVSPYTRRGAVVSTNYNQTSMIRTMELILGLPPMNQLDRTALPMTDCFTETADLTPYVARPNIVPLAELNPPLATCGAW